MTTIRTTYKRCGDVELTTADIGLELAPRTRPEATDLPALPAASCSESRPIIAS